MLRRWEGNLRWHLPHWFTLEKTCLSCRNQWGMHHRCPALGGRWNCC